MEELLKQLKELNEGIYTDDQSGDEVIIRELIADEYTAVKKYEDFANKTTNENVRKVLLDIKKEELVHIGELEKLLNIRGILDGASKIEGAREVEDTLSQ